MKKNYYFVFLCALLLISTNACKSDDDSFQPIPIETVADLAQVLQNQSVSITVLQNDTNVPTEGVLTINQPQNGVAQILDPNNTPNNPSDDLVTYAANSTFLGDVSFEYTLCQGSNCSTALVTVTIFEGSPVQYDLAAMPYPKLSDYNFFEGQMANQDPVFGVLPYKPINKLFTDYAKKNRYIWMPSGVSAAYVDDHQVLDFPTGTILIKTFYYENVQPTNDKKIIETRLMIKKETHWVFANYLWNENQTEASFDLIGGFEDFDWILNGETKSVHYRIPSESECFTCHKSNIDNTPISPKPQNLNSSYSYMEGAKNQLEKWIEMGYLENNLPGTINTVTQWDDVSLPPNDRMRGYVDINCAHCHYEYGHCDYRPLRLAWKDTTDDVNLGVCVDPDTGIFGKTKIVEPSNLDNSILYFRFSTVKENYRMPLLGRSLVHEEAVELAEEWINSLTLPCN